MLLKLCDMCPKYPLIHARRKISAFFSRFPTLFMPLARLVLIIQKQKYKIPHVLVSNDTELVIEGYPRCANSFAVSAFQMAQDRPVKMAHHLHLPINVILAAKRNIPCLVLIRHPAECVLSLAVSYLKSDVRQALKEYVRFYKQIRLFRENYVVASFEEVTDNFGFVIRKVNHKFGTDFREFRHTAENVKRCFSRIELTTLMADNTSNINELIASRPSRYRDKLKYQLKKELEDPELETLRKYSYDLYQDFISHK